MGGVYSGSQKQENASISTATNNAPSGYHTVTICSTLPKVQKDYNEYDKPQDLPDTDFWVRIVDKDADRNRYKVQHIIANGQHTSSSADHAIFKAFLRAYNSHEDIVLSPDDIWLMICIYFSKYVNENAEKLRTIFVDHEGKKRLTVFQTAVKEPNWDDFLEEMRQKVGENVKNNVVDLLNANFSTTTKVESLLSCVAIMDTFKQYFEYHCMITKCGIRNVHFMGTLDDWKLLRHKTEQLQNFTTSRNDSFASYIEGILPIIDQFIQTYEGKVDKKFWNKIMDIKHIGGGRSGSRVGTDISGWFLRLCYGLHEQKKCDIQQIRLNSLVAPVRVDNAYTNQSKMCYIAGGFHGVDSRHGRHKPVMSLAIMDDTTTIKPYSPN